MKIKAIKFSFSIALSISLLTPIMAAHAETTSWEQTIKDEADKPRKSKWPVGNLSDGSPVGQNPGGSVLSAPPPPAQIQESVKNIRDSFRDSAALSGAVVDSERIIVKYKEGANTGPLFAKYALKQVGEFSKYGLEVVEAPKGKEVEPIIAQLEKDPNVLYAEPDFKVHAASAPNDPLFNEQWGLHNTGQASSSGMFSPGLENIDVDMPEAWDIGTGSSDLIVAVIDTGVDINHPDLKDNIWTNPGEIAGNGIDDDGDGFADDVHGWDFYHGDGSVHDLLDVDVHGTKVAGIIAASANNDIGIAGIAPKVKIMPLKFMGPLEEGYVSGAIRAIEYADYMGARIANLSWAFFQYSQALKDAIDASPMFFVAAAGNYELDVPSMDNDVDPAYPASYDSDNILSVTAINNTGTTSYLDYRYGLKSVDVAAPSNGILSTYPSDQIGLAAEIETPDYKVIYNGMGFEKMYEDYDNSGNTASHWRQDAFDKAIGYFGLDRSSARILLVQDDEHEVGFGDYLEDYEALLDGTGYSYDTLTIPAVDDEGNVAENNGPLLQKLKSYDLVVWYTGQGYGFSEVNTTLTKDDQSNLIQYLQQGGNLLLTGESSLYGIEESYFVKDMLHLDMVRPNYRGDDLWNKLQGLPGTAYEGEVYNNVGSSDYLTSISSNDPEVSTINLEVPISGYDFGFGSSMSAPFATGIAALILNQTPAETNKLVKERIMLSGKTLAVLQGDQRYQQKAAIASGKMVNAHRALSDDDITGMPLHGNTQTGALDAGADTDDVYYVYLNAGDKLGLDLTGDDSTDFDLYVYGPSATTVSSKKGIVAESEKSGSSQESIIYVATETGYHFIDIFGYDGAGNYSFNTSFGKSSGNYEETDDAIAFTGPWSSVSNSDYSGGSAKLLNDTGSVSLSFKGSEIEWIGFMDSKQGTADVYIDSVKVASPSLTSETLKTKQSLFKQELPYGLHTIQVEWSESNRQPKEHRDEPSLAINVDAFRVTGEPVPVPPKELAVKFEETNEFVQFKGIWKTRVSVLDSGGGEKYTDVKGNYVQFNFTGTKVELVAGTGGNRGKANIYIDGKPASSEPVDFYSESFRHGVSLFQSADLASGNHTLRIENIGEKNERSSGFTIAVDVFKVTKK